ncbi:ABC transporter permease [candidate division WOR-3 bacterium]|nr:ABC transporter permease [candidate division WOR-3 bacterium]
MKHIIKLGFKNIFRNKRRTFLTITAVFFATFLVVMFKSFIGGLWGSTINNVIMLETGHVKVAHKKYLEKEKTQPLEYYVVDAEKIINQLEELSEVNFATPRIKAPVMLNINDKNYYTQLLAINPEKEKRFNVIHEKIVDGEYLSSDSKGIMVGSGFAEKFDLHTGQRITLLSPTVYNSISVESFKITGIFTYGIKSLDERLMVAPIASVQDLVKMGDGTSEILILLDNIEKSLAVEDEVNAMLPEEYTAEAWENQENYFNMIRIATQIYNVVYFFFLLLASFVIINTILISVYEREREIGALTALGMSRGEVLYLFVTEAGILSIIGSLLGSLSGGLISFILSKVGINTIALFGETMSDLNISNVIYLKAQWQTVIFAFIFGFLVSIIFASIPAFKAVKVDPIRALRAT